MITLRIPAFLCLLILVGMQSCTTTDADEFLENPGLSDSGDNPAPPTTGEILSPCEDGFAGVYPCLGYDLVATVGLDQLGAEEANDVWGWTDPASGREFALAGVVNGTVFVELTEPARPVIIGSLPTETNSSPWRDVKVYDHYALVVSEARDHGLQVFDLTRLLNTTTIPSTFEPDAVYTGFGNAHNVVVNADEAVAYAVGTGGDDFGGGVHFVDLSDPLNPRALGGYGEGGYTHDAQVVKYTGPDSDYTNRSILVGANEDAVVLVDVTDKANPRQIASLDYEFLGYTHQGWFTEDQRYFLLGDEFDEISFGVNSRTIVFDFTDLDNPVAFAEYRGPTGAIDHNGYVRGNAFYLANYTAGFREVDLGDISSGNLVEVAFFDTYPENDRTAFNGAWSVYPYFDSKHILINDIDSGLFIVKRSDAQ